MKFDTWVTLFKNRNDASRNADLPVVTPWKTTSPITTPTWVLERNPYSVWVDTDGNQLPYIDQIRMTLGENLEVINLRAIAGEYDSQARHIDIGKLPALLENQQRGGYRVYLDPSAQGADVGLFCNQSFDKDPEIAKWLTTREFRIALSHGIDRAQINETFVLGLGQTGSAAPGDGRIYFPGPEFKTLHAIYDVKKANEMLDKLGLTRRTARASACGPMAGAACAWPSPPTWGSCPFTQIAEMIVEQWKKIGIHGEVQELERGLATARVQGNEHQIYFETQWGADNIFGHVPLFFPDNCGARWDRSTASGSPARRQGQDAAAADARADGHVPEVLRRQGRGADQAGEGGLEDLAGRAMDDPGRVELARLPGRPRHQDQHGQYPRAPLEQRRQRQPAHRPHGDLVLQVLSVTVRGGGAGRGEGSAGSAARHQFSRDPISSATIGSLDRVLRRTRLPSCAR